MTEITDSRTSHIFSKSVIARSPCPHHFSPAHAPPPQTSTTHVQIHVHPVPPHHSRILHAFANMTEPSTTEPAAPPKKRSLFKKAAWQTAVKPEGKEKDIFSHSDTFNDIIADQARLNKAKKDKAQAAKKRKAEEEGDRKRRKVSLDAEKSKLPGSGSGSSSQTSRTESKG